MAKMSAMGEEIVAISVNTRTWAVSRFGTSRGCAFARKRIDVESSFVAYLSDGKAFNNDVTVLRKQVSQLFNLKFMSATGLTKCSYKRMASDFAVEGLPVGVQLPLRHPSFYGQKTLQAILECSDSIKFIPKPQDAIPLSSATETTSEWSQLDQQLMLVIEQNAEAPTTSLARTWTNCVRSQDIAAATVGPGAINVQAEMQTQTSSEPSTCGGQNVDSATTLSNITSIDVKAKRRIKRKSLNSDIMTENECRKRVVAHRDCTRKVASGCKRTADQDNVYAVEKIVGAKSVKGQPYYLVKWKGYPKSENTWEPASNILNKRIVELYKNKSKCN